MQKLIKFFETAGFSGADLDTVVQAFSLKTFKKGDFFVEEGKTSRYLGFIKSGLFQYFVLKDGEERSTYVSIENTFLASVMSFVGEKPAKEYVRALTDSEVYLLRRDTLKTLVQDIPAFKDFYVQLLESSICGIDSSRHDLIVLNADQRYEKMLREEPHHLQQIPLQYLASMLGITPRHLSRIRKNIR
ncbi:MAG: Crp/Fnr family transcriptional regulator [Saprospiraceae bacterium]|nr:Crp/Fnr family transcriptional regulator [Saprospiraceae bacterium]